MGPFACRRLEESIRSGKTGFKDSSLAYAQPADESIANAQFSHPTSVQVSSLLIHLNRDESKQPRTLGINDLSFPPAHNARTALVHITTPNMADPPPLCDLPDEMFTIIKQTTSTLSPRLGRLALPSRNPIQTPHFLASTSRGVVPHLTPDTFRRDTSISAVYLALEDCESRCPTAAAPRPRALTTVLTA